MIFYLLCVYKDINIINYYFIKFNFLVFVSQYEDKW